MKNEKDERLERIFARAREAAPDISAVERGFETRVMARIRERREAPERWIAWAWRLAPVFLALTIVLGTWSLVLDPVRPTDPGTAIASSAEEVAMVDFLTGE
jgi:hypothetical protein